MTQQIPGTPQYDSPEEWSRLKLGGKDIPGFAIVRVRRANKWDRKEPKGEHGEEQEYNGARAADVDIEIRLRNSAEYAEFATLLPDFEPDPGKKEQKPHEIVHPATRVRNVRSICIDNIDGPDVDGQDNVFQLACFEHRPRSNKNAKGTAKGGGVVSAECQEALRNHENLLTKWATASTPAEQLTYDLLLDTNYQVLIGLGCEQHAPPAGEPVGFPEQEDPEDAKEEKKSPIDAIIEELGF
jgi:hypothetical protein